MHRRAFFGTLAGALVAAPVVPALAQTMPKVRGRLTCPDWLAREALAHYERSISLGKALHAECGAAFKAGDTVRVRMPWKA